MISCLLSVKSLEVGKVEGSIVIEVFTLPYSTKRKKKSFKIKHMTSYDLKFFTNHRMKSKFTCHSLFFLSMLLLHLSFPTGFLLHFCPLNPSVHKLHPVTDSIRVPLPAPLDACNIPQHLAAHAYVLILSLNVCNCK